MGNYFAQSMNCIGKLFLLLVHNFEFTECFVLRTVYKVHAFKFIFYVLNFIGSMLCRNRFFITFLALFFRPHLVLAPWSLETFYLFCVLVYGKNTLFELLVYDAIRISICLLSLFIAYFGFRLYQIINKRFSPHCVVLSNIYS